MFIVIETQFRENYGAHDWDGEGSCPQYWKIKGGSTYIFENITAAQAQDKAFWNAVEASVIHRDEYSEEYIIHSDLVDTIEEATAYCQDWETPFMVDFANRVVSTYKEMDEHSYLRQEVKAKRESWNFVENVNEHNDYLVVYQVGDKWMSYQDTNDYFAAKDAEMA